MTKAVQGQDEGAAQWSARQRRKNHSRLDTGRGSTWWAPGAIGWWIGVLFAFGATMFALGAAPGYRTAVGNGPDGLTFFIGSLFFTSAAALQYLESVNSRLGQGRPGGGRHLRVFVFEPKNLAWWASLVQLVGTVYFNVSTFQAMHTNLSMPQVDLLVWKPDALGSVCFLVASSLCVIEFRRESTGIILRSYSWWTLWLNMLGSLAFGVSAIASYVVRTTSNPVNITLVNLGTFIGGICFFTGAVLLLPERTHGG